MFVCFLTIALLTTDWNGKGETRNKFGLLSCFPSRNTPVDALVTKPCGSRDAITIINSSSGGLSGKEEW